jgi:hypothetical protein
VNSQHFHETAEVFFVHSGRWAFRTGEHAEDAEVILEPGDTISIPVHVFRGFENVGTGVGFLYAVLGGNDPGRVVWAPDVLEKARIVATLDEALEGISHLCATAMTPRDFGPPTVEPRAHFEMLLKQERLAHEATITTLSEREQALENSEKEKVAAEQRARELQAEKANAEEEISKLKSFEENARCREAARTERINRIAERTARISFVFSGIVFAAVGAMALFSNWSPWLAVPAAIVGFFNLWSGFSGNTIERAVKNWVARRLSDFMS